VVAGIPFISLFSYSIPLFCLNKTLPAEVKNAARSEVTPEANGEAKPEPEPQRFDHPLELVKGVYRNRLASAAASAGAGAEAAAARPLPTRNRPQMDRNMFDMISKKSKRKQNATAALNCAVQNAAAVAQNTAALNYRIASLNENLAPNFDDTLLIRMLAPGRPRNPRVSTPQQLGNLRATAPKLQETPGSSQSQNPGPSQQTLEANLAMTNEAGSAGRISGELIPQGLLQAVDQQQQERPDFHNTMMQQLQQKHPDLHHTMMQQLQPLPQQHQAQPPPQQHAQPSQMQQAQLPQQQQMQPPQQMQQAQLPQQQQMQPPQQMQQAPLPHLQQIQDPHQQLMQQVQHEQPPQPHLQPPQQQGQPQENQQQDQNQEDQNQKEHQHSHY
jgi:hypothetical protein